MNLVPVSQPFLDRLTNTHLTSNPTALLVWNNFVEAVVSALREAEIRLRDPIYWAYFSAKKGWWRRAMQKNSAKLKVRIPEEDALTDALTMILEEIRQDSAPSDPLVQQNIVFACQQPRKVQLNIGPKCLSTDIRAFVPDNRELDLRIEAKLLFKKSDLDHEYCSLRGIKRFADEFNPYTDSIIGAILGYSVTGTISDWEDDIEDKLSTVMEVNNISRADLGNRSTLVCDVPRIGGPVVTVLNLLMRFETDPQSPGLLKFYFKI